MKRFSPLVFCISVFCCWFVPAAPADVVRVHGAISAAIAVAEAAKTLKNERNVELQITITGGSTGGIAALGEGEVEVALTTKHVTAEERADSPKVAFNEIQMGAQAIALTVSHDVWESGVHALTADQVRKIYEGKIRNWKEVGGEDFKISMFMMAPGRGVWEMFAQWLYGEVRKAPVKDYPNVSTYEEVHNAVEFTPGSFSQIPLPCIDNKALYPVSIIDDAGKTIQPTPENLANGNYPLCRSLYMVVNERPTLSVKVLVDFMLSDRGQELLKKVSLVPMAGLQTSGTAAAVSSGTSQKAGEAP